MKSQLETELQQVIFRVLCMWHRTQYSCVALSCTCIENVVKLIFFQEYSALVV